MKPTNFHITDQLRVWEQMTVLRYAQLSNTNKLNSKSKRNKGPVTNAHLNHPLNWSGFSKVVLHAASQEIVLANSLYAYIGLAFACVGGQTPSLIKSKQSIAQFHLIKGSLMGGFSVLRKKHLLQYQYKLCWLGPNACAHWYGANQIRRSVGLQYFAFPEPDLLDYHAFDTLKGFEFHLA
jgi:hypothetical protein